MGQKWDACIDCGSLKDKKHQSTARCQPCSRRRGAVTRTIRPTWFSCISCGTEKTTKAQRLNARCKPCASKEANGRPDVREKNSAAQKRRACDPTILAKMKAVQNQPELRINKSLRAGGDGDIERMNRKRLHIEEYRSKPHFKWSLAVKERDGYICKHCGSNRWLHAHHIKPKAMHPELALEIDNGLTLCRDCHLAEHRRIRLEIKQP